MIDTVRFSLYGIDTELKTPDNLSSWGNKMRLINETHNLINSEDPKNLTLDEDYNLFSKYLVPEHQALYISLLKYKGSYHNVTVVERNEIQSVDEMSSEKFLENQAIFRDSFLKKKMNFHNYTFNSMTMVRGFKKSKIVLSEKIETKLISSNRDINIFVNVNRGCLTFEFSIPKFLYGHNIAQFIPQLNSKKYKNNLFDLSRWDFQVEEIYKRFFDFFDKFFTELCVQFGLEMLPNYNYLNVERIDLCYNQVYQSKFDALYTLDYMKKIAHRIKNKNKIEGSDYATAIHYKTSNGSTFKIYHKGSEFKLKDYRELNKLNFGNAKKLLSKSKYYRFFLDNKDLIFLNLDELDFSENNVFEKQKKFSYLEKISDLSDEDKLLIRKIRKYLKNSKIVDVDFLQAEADKILRFEIGFRPDFMKYHYKDKIFRKKCSIHKRFRSKYKTIKSIYDFRNNKSLELDEVSIKDKRFFKRFDAWRNKSCKFWLQGSSVFKRYEKSGKMNYDSATDYYEIRSFSSDNDNILCNPVNALFSKDLLVLMFGYFKKMIDKYQIKSLDFEEDLSKKIDIYNESCLNKRKIYDNKSSNLFLIKDLAGNYKYVKNRTFDNPAGVSLKRPSDLLTQKDLYKKGFVGVNKMKLLNVFDFLKTGGSLDDYRKKYGISSSNFCRLKFNLKKFDVFQNSFFVKKRIYVKTDFTDYYSNLSKMDYSSKFYVKKMFISDSEND